MIEISLNMYQTAGIAMLLFVLGRFLTNRIEFLRKCCIPAPVVGGLIFALAHLALYLAGIIQFTFDENVKNFFMTLFFTSVGYTACFRLLKKGGPKVVTFLLEHDGDVPVNAHIGDSEDAYVASAFSIGYYNALRKDLMAFPIIKGVRIA